MKNLSVYQKPALQVVLFAKNILMESVFSEETDDITVTDKWESWK